MKKLRRWKKWPRWLMYNQKNPSEDDLRGLRIKHLRMSPCRRWRRHPKGPLSDAPRRRNLGALLLPEGAPQLRSCQSPHPLLTLGRLLLRCCSFSVHDTSTYARRNEKNIEHGSNKTLPISNDKSKPGAEDTWNRDAQARGRAHGPHPSGECQATQRVGCSPGVEDASDCGAASRHDADGT